MDISAGSVDIRSASSVDISASSVAINGVNILASYTALNTSYTALKASYTALKAALDESNANTNAAIKALKDACGAASGGRRLTTGCAGDKGTGDKGTGSVLLVGTLLALSLTTAAVA